MATVVRSEVYLAIHVINNPRGRLLPRWSLKIDAILPMIRPHCCFTNRNGVDCIKDKIQTEDK